MKNLSKWSGKDQGQKIVMLNIEVEAVTVFAFEHGKFFNKISVE